MAAPEVARRHCSGLCVAPFLQNITNENINTIDQQLMASTYLPRCFLAAGHMLEKFVSISIFYVYTQIRYIVVLLRHTLLVYSFIERLKSHFFR